MVQREPRLHASAHRLPGRARADLDGVARGLGREANVPIEASGDYRQVDRSFDLVFSVFYDRILKEDFIRAQTPVRTSITADCPATAALRRSTGR